MFRRQIILLSLAIVTLSCVHQSVTKTSLEPQKGLGPPIIPSLNSSSTIFVGQPLDEMNEAAMARGLRGPSESSDGWYQQRPDGEWRFVPRIRFSVGDEFILEIWI